MSHTYQDKGDSPMMYNTATLWKEPAKVYKVVMGCPKEDRERIHQVISIEGRRGRAMCMFCHYTYGYGGRDD